MVPVYDKLKQTNKVFMLNLGQFLLQKGQTGTPALQIISLHATLQCEKHKHCTR